MYITKMYQDVGIAHWGGGGGGGGGGGEIPAPHIKPGTYIKQFSIQLQPHPRWLNNTKNIVSSFWHLSIYVMLM